MNPTESAIPVVGDVPRASDLEVPASGGVDPDLLDAVSRELRDPLSAMTTAAQVLLGSDDPTRVRVGRRIRKSVRRMADLVSDLRDVSRGGGGSGIAANARPMDLARTVRRVLDDLRAAHPDRRIDFRRRGPSRGEWDPGRMEQVVSTLVGHALEHGRDPVEVVLRREDDAQFLEIRSRPGAARPTPGLGLYVVREIVRAHGGAVDARSSGAEGAVAWTVRLPAGPREGEAARWRPRGSGARGRSREKPSGPGNAGSE